MRPAPRASSSGSWWTETRAGRPAFTRSSRRAGTRPPAPRSRSSTAKAARAASSAAMRCARCAKVSTSSCPSCGLMPSTGDLISYGHHESVDLSLLLKAAAERFGLDPGGSASTAARWARSSRSSTPRDASRAGALAAVPVRRPAAHGATTCTGPRACRPRSFVTRAPRARERAAVHRHPSKLDPALLAPRVRCP
jgi:hypothetical protein